MKSRFGVSLAAAVLVFASAGFAAAQAPDAYIGEVRMFAGNFAPRGWALCDGQLMPINQNQSLFSIVGTIYGGDGRTTFGLPDLRGRVPMHPGNGPGLSPRRLGESRGSETNQQRVVAVAAATPQNQLNAFVVGATPQQTSVKNTQPYTCINFIICLQGTYPSRN